ncbi:uncharacterized protein LOC110263307 isoform X1 [Arachis ipaensis]|uniref:uncharacterized protein n=1 Tax=Arachis hypogaea TaxID=3818 RepID=UPI000A2B6DF4|nr:uncharacterized protein LOC110263307 isoform X1 [Arachis ipaensis]XP_020960103.1 uncharacterized protein LOC110263307 isoform X2 [Arachis ipaensis]XP_020960104.1 uncharacterized protein LOC110263307 isoform X1 [Arachis ipaensis]XP_020960105.1 uncharacterized protein LOC110263307 isoform X1 [Arachis ipaensis]XP_029149562.1 uncharacterized protein LOC112754198 isoform X1 [Arachis hypogaea]XP_029149563.1 uncharacterized protein LOC112754198 isoform X2 [Arachis hypogaea]XP_029149564.1 uncharac
MPSSSLPGERGRDEREPNREGEGAVSSSCRRVAAVALTAPPSSSSQSQPPPLMAKSERENSGTEETESSEAELGFNHRAQPLLASPALPPSERPSPLPPSEFAAADDGKPNRSQKRVQATAGAAAGEGSYVSAILTAGSRSMTSETTAEASGCSAVAGKLYR